MIFRRSVALRKPLEQALQEVDSMPDGEIAQEAKVEIRTVAPVEQTLSETAPPTEPATNIFWMVWCENGGRPTFKHWERANAEREAERLARENEGHLFYVLEAVAAKRVKVLEPPIEDIRIIARTHADEGVF